MDLRTEVDNIVGRVKTSETRRLVANGLFPPGTTLEVKVLVVLPERKAILEMAPATFFCQANFRLVGYSGMIPRTLVEHIKTYLQRYANGSAAMMDALLASGHLSVGIMKRRRFSDRDIEAVQKVLKHYKLLREE